MKHAKTAIVTGGTSGLGFHVAEQLIRHGYFVVLTGRELKNFPGEKENFEFARCNFDDLQNVADVLIPLSKSIINPAIIFCNAGVLPPKDFTRTKDGFEYSLQVNVIANLLAAMIFAGNRSLSDDSIVASTTSPVIKYIKPDLSFREPKGYSPVKAYSATKYLLAYSLFSAGDRMGLNGMRSIAIDPGTFSSGIYRMQGSLFGYIYRAAAPFMRPAERVARRVTGVLEADTNSNRIIIPYRGKSYSLPEVANSQEIERFSEECFNAASGFLKTS